MQIKASNLLLLAGRFDDAKARAQQLLARDPKNVEAQIVLANALAGLKDVDGAVAQIEDAIKSNPERSGTYANLGALELARGQTEAAGRAYKRAVDINPSSVSAQLALGNFYWVTSQWAAAEECLKKAVGLEPDNALANRALASFYLATGHVPQAEQPLKRVMEITKTPQASLALADYYAATGNAQGARGILDPLRADSRTEPAANARLAALDYKSGDRQGAYDRLTSILRRDKSNLQALLLRCSMLLDEGKLNEALADASAAAAAHPESTAAHYAVGRVQVARRQPEAAVRAFEETLRLNPRATDAKIALAKLNLSQGRAEASVGYAQEALTIEPANAEARLILTRGLLARGDLNGAERELNRLTPRFGNSAAVQAQMGFLEGRKGNLSAAREHFDRALALNPSSTEALAGLVALDLSSRNCDAAKARIDPTVHSAKPDPAHLMLAARTYAGCKDLASTEKFLRQAIDVDPNYLAAYSALGQLYVTQNRLDAARAEFDTLADKTSKPVGALTMAGMVLQAQGNIADARRHYERALQFDATAPVPANNLAWIRAQSGDNLDAALQLAQTAHQRLPDSAEISDTLGYIYYRKQMTSLAVSTLTACVAKDPGNALYAYHLGLAYAQAGEKAKARESLSRALQLQPDFDGSKDARALLSTLGS